MSTRQYQLVDYYEFNTGHLVMTNHGNHTFHGEVNEFYLAVERLVEIKRTGLIQADEKRIVDFDTDCEYVKTLARMKRKLHELKTDTFSVALDKDVITGTQEDSISLPLHDGAGRNWGFIIVHGYKEADN